MEYGNQGTGVPPRPFVSGVIDGRAAGNAVRERGGELSSVVQRAQKLAEMASIVAQKTGAVDSILGAQNGAVGPAAEALPPQSHIAAMHDALDKAERSLGYAINQLDRLNASLS